MSIFGNVLTLTVLLLQAYLFWRLSGIPLVKQRLGRRTVLRLALVSGLLFYLSRVFGGHQGLLEKTLEFFAMHWMASMFLLAVALFAADLLRGFGLFFRPQRSKFHSIALLCGLGLVLLAQLQGLRPPRVNRVEVRIAGLAGELEGTSIAVLADVHAGEMGIGPAWLAARARQVMELEPDMIVLLGDVFERASDPAEMIPVMREFKAPLGVWAVRGNHESKRAGRRDVLAEILEGAGIGLLENEWVSPAENLIIAGIDDLTSSRRRPGAGLADLEQALLGRPEGKLILLSHTPWLVGEAAARGVDLMISGHTHNGQIWPFNHLVAIRYPFVGGRYQQDEMTLLVNRGSGTWGPRMRLWRPGEITLVVLCDSTGMLI